MEMFVVFSSMFVVASDEYALNKLAKQATVPIGKYTTLNNPLFTGLMQSISEQLQNMFTEFRI